MNHLTSLPPSSLLLDVVSEEVFREHRSDYHPLGLTCSKIMNIEFNSNQMLEDYYLSPFIKQI